MRNDRRYHFEVNQKVVSEIYELSENFSFADAAVAAFNVYARCLKLRQKGFRLVAVPIEDESRLDDATAIEVMGGDKAIDDEPEEV